MAKIMIVDDESMFREILRRSALRLGHEVDTAGDSTSALSRGQRFAPDILFVDWMLGSEKNGLQVAESLAETLPKLITIVISGDLSLELAVDSSQAGRVSLLPKPFGLDEFHHAIDRAIEQIDGVGAIDRVDRIARAQVSQRGGAPRRDTHSPYGSSSRDS